MSLGLYSLSLLGLVLFLCGCGTLSDKDTPQQQPTANQTIADLYFAPLPLDHTPLEQPETKSMRDAYKVLLEMVGDPQTKQIVQYRLADLEVLLAEQIQENGIPIEPSLDGGEQPKQNPQKLFEAAIEQYQHLLQQHPHNSDNVEVFYQLAKAYEQQGQMQASLNTLQQLLQQFPDNEYLAEIHFRLGELAFNRANYELAIHEYNKVLIQGEQNPYYATAAYMLGWSFFKNEQQTDALKAFTTLLDHQLPNEIVAQSMLSQVDSQKQIDSLAVGQKRLVKDTIRIMSLLFSYQDNEYSTPADSIAAHFARVKSRHYEYVLYDALAQHYLNQDRYLDSAKTFKAFTEVHGEHFQAPIFAVKQIDSYILGEFPSLVLPAKQQFVTHYGISGEYWPKWPLVLQEQVAPFLNEYLQELAQYEHSLGQVLASKSQKQSVNPNKKGVSKPQELQAQSTQALLRASQWYQEFISTFPKDPQTPEVTYRLGEALFEAQHYGESIKAFEDYAYQHLQPSTHQSDVHPKAAEAAYAAILAYQKIQLQTQGDQSWLDKQLIAQEKFVSTFADDPRARDILYNSMQQLFGLKRYDSAIHAAQKWLERQPNITSEKSLASYLVIAHSQFALQQYELGESSYEKIIQMLPNKDPRLADIRERLAASIYKQGEQNVKNNYLPLAVNDFLRVIAKTPNSSIRVSAQYDAASYLLQMQQWQQGIDLFVDFRRRFPHNDLTKNIQSQLILAYQQNENWQLAADELLLLHKTKPQTEVGRQALYVAAQYLHKIGNRQQALDAYRTYAHSYAHPFAEANQARFIMSEFYLESNEYSKRRFWLKKLIQADIQAQQSTDIERDTRTRYLAAMASSVFADDKLRAFRKIKLTQPLKASLAKKKAALNAALEAYNKTLGYKVEEFSTLANFSIADIYHQLAKDLMASSKPKNLNSLELEQYELLLEEQAYPFEEKAINIHETNIKRSWQGSYDVWVQKSFSALQKLLPGRYNKQERNAEFIDEIY